MNRKAQNVILRIDGCSLGNPGPAGIGVIMEIENGEIVIKRSKALGVKINNEAEYMALIEGLKLASRFKGIELTVYSDSLLLVKQMRGEYKVSNKILRELYFKVRKLQK
ncbi:MAG: ribonuclease HI family protein, partial [Candidatus Bathyarchaeia archaeon]